MSTTFRRVVVAVGIIALMVITVLTFVTFDRDSHSASDTLRPFVITMVPLWVMALGAGRFLLSGKHL